MVTSITDNELETTVRTSSEQEVPKSVVELSAIGRTATTKQDASYREPGSAPYKYLQSGKGNDVAEADYQYQKRDTAIVDPNKVYGEPDGRHLCYGEGPIDPISLLAKEDTEENGFDSWVLDPQHNQYKKYFLDQSGKLQLSNFLTKDEFGYYKDYPSDTSFYEFTDEEVIFHRRPFLREPQEEWIPGRFHHAKLLRKTGEPAANEALVQKVDQRRF